MRRPFVAGAVLAVALALGSAGSALAVADDEAPCIGEAASATASALGVGFGQGVIKPEATAGLTGTVASTGARLESCP